MLRIDDVEYQHVLGLRLNVWTSIVLFVLAAVYFVLVGRRHSGRETEVYDEKRLAADRTAAGELGEADSADPSVLSPDTEPVTDREPMVERGRDPAD
jgi:hypothetical protein